MKLWKLAATIAIGVWSSGSGAIQVNAASFVYFVDFNTKLVNNFNDFRPTFLPTTNNLQGKINFTFNTFYQMNNCLSNEATNNTLNLRYALNNSGTVFSTDIELPDMACNTSTTFYQISGSVNLPDEHTEFLVSDDNNFIRLTPLILMRFNSSASTRIITLNNSDFVYGIEYEFNNTYLFNYFLADQDYVIQSNSGGISYNNVIIIDFDFVMTTAGDDEYFIINDRLTDFGFSRRKWAINYEDIYFRGQSVGARFKIIRNGPIVVDLTSANQFIRDSVDFYYLNTSNYQQPLADVPQFNFVEEDCGSFLALNVGCFINNGLAYITNDAPIISDIFTLLNVGMQLGGQAFAVLGNFSNNNLIGVLVLGGAGLTAVRWFLKQD